MFKFILGSIFLVLSSCAWTNEKSEVVYTDKIKIHCQDTVLVCFQFSEAIKSLDCVYDPLLVNEHCRDEK